MAIQPFLVRIVGIPHIASVTEVNVRSGPSTNAELAFKAPVGMPNLSVLDVKPDAENKALAGKIYQWFQLSFPDGRAGWIRDDLIEVTGDGTRLGYSLVTQPTLAFDLVRRTVIQPGQETILPVGAAAATTSASAQPAAAQQQTVTATPIAPSQTPAVSAAQPAATGPGIAVCMAKTGANVRPGAGTQYNPPVMRLPFKAEAQILEAKKGEQTGDPFKWVKISYQGQQGWIREDFVRLKGSFGSFGVASEDQYSSSIPDSWWVRDFNLDANLTNFTSVHWGWDHGAMVGSPILAGPNGGLVVSVRPCQKCGAQGASTVERGFQLSDPRILQDEGWNFGYGNFVVVRYHHDQLPESTRQKLSAQGKAGWHIFVMYAHLSQMLVQERQTLAPNQHIAACGNSGNSEAAHLHLEVRAHANENEINWSRMRDGLMTPAILYLR